MDRRTPDVESTADIWKQIAQHSAHYVLWFTICALGFWLIFLIRTNLIEDVFFMQVNPWQLRAVDRWFVYALGAVWIFCVMLIEGHLRRSMESGRLLRSASRILIVQVGLIVLSFIVHFI